MSVRMVDVKFLEIAVVRNFRALKKLSPNTAKATLVKMTEAMAITPAIPATQVFEAIVRIYRSTKNRPHTIAQLSAITGYNLHQIRRVFHERVGLRSNFELLIGSKGLWRMRENRL